MGRQVGIKEIKDMEVYVLQIEVIDVYHSIWFHYLLQFIIPVLLLR